MFFIKFFNAILFVFPLYCACGEKVSCFENIINDKKGFFFYVLAHGKRSVSDDDIYIRTKFKTFNVSMTPTRDTTNPCFFPRNKTVPLKKMTLFFAETFCLVKVLFGNRQDLLNRKLHLADDRRPLFFYYSMM